MDALKDYFKKYPLENMMGSIYLSLNAGENEDINIILNNLNLLLLEIEFVEPPLNNYTSLIINNILILEHLVNILENYKELNNKLRYNIELQIDGIKFPLRIHTNTNGKTIITKKATKRISICT